jgi:hypothetical protein
MTMYVDTMKKTFANLPLPLRTFWTVSTMAKLLSLLRWQITSSRGTRVMNLDFRRCCPIWRRPSYRPFLFLLYEIELAVATSLDGLMDDALPNCSNTTLTTPAANPILSVLPDILDMDSSILDALFCFQEELIIQAPSLIKFVVRITDTICGQDQRICGAS